MTAEELARARFAAQLAKVESLLEKRLVENPRDGTSVRIGMGRGWHITCWPSVSLTAGLEQWTWYFRLLDRVGGRALDCPVRSLDPSVRAEFLDQCAALVVRDFRERMADLLTEFSAEAGATGEIFMAEAGSAVAKMVHED